MRMGPGLATLAMYAALSVGAEAQVAPKSPPPLGALSGLAAGTADTCIILMEPRSANGQTIVIGTGTKVGGGTVQFYLTASAFNAAVNPSSTSVPSESSGWASNATPAVVSQLHEAAAGGAMVRLKLGAAAGPYQPVTGVVYFYQSPSCIGVHG